MPNEAARRGLRIWTSLVVVLAVLAGAVVVTSSGAVGASRTTGVDYTVALSGVGDGASLKVGFGLDPDEYEVVANGDDGRGEGAAEGTGLLQAYDGEALVGMSVVPKSSQFELVDVTVDDDSTVIAMLFLLPGVPSQDPLADALVIDAASTTAELDRAVEVFRDDQQAGADPLAEPSEQLQAALYDLLAATNAELQDRFDDAVAALRAQGAPVAAPGGDRAERAARQLEQSPATTALGLGSEPAPVTAVAHVASQSGRPPLQGACEDPARAEACGTNFLNPGDRCETALNGLVIDLDGFEGDNVCLSAESGDVEAGTITIKAINYSPRWVFLYDGQNDGVRPDAIIEPKKWDLPAFQELAADLAELLVGMTIDTVTSSVWGVINFFRGETVEVTSPAEALDRRFKAMLAEYNKNTKTTFELDGGPTGGQVHVVTTGFWRDAPEGADWGRFLSVTATTGITEILLPAARLALDSGVVLKEQCQDEESDALWYEATDLCAAVASLGVNLGILLTTEISADAALTPERLVTILFDSLTIMGEVVMSETLDDLFREATDDRPFDPHEFLEDAVEDGHYTKADFLADIKGQVLKVIEQGLGLDDVTNVMTEVVEAVVEQLLLTVASAATGPLVPLIRLLKDLDVYLDLGFTVFEFLLEGWEYDTNDRYRLQAAALEDLPDATKPQSDNGILAVDRSVATTTFLVVDESGSMGEATPGGTGPKFGAAREAADGILGVIALDAKVGGADHRVGIIGFDDGVVRDLAPTTDLERVASEARQFSANGGTNIAGALAAAFGELEQTPGLKTVVLMSDGIVDASQQSQILDIYPELARVEGVTINTVAFALPNSDPDNFLRTLATRTGGSFVEADTAFELQSAFIRTRHQDTSAAPVQESVGTLTTSSDTVLLTVPERLAGDQSAGSLVVTILTNGNRFDVTVLDPLSVPIDDDDLLVEEGNPLSVSIDDPVPGIWTLQLRQRNGGPEGGVVIGAMGVAPVSHVTHLAAPAGAAGAPVAVPLAAAERSDGEGSGEYRLFASIRPRVDEVALSPAPAGTIRLLAWTPLAVWLLLVAIGIFVLRRRPQAVGSGS